MGPTLFVQALSLVGAPASLLGVWGSGTCYAAGASTNPGRLGSDTLPW